MPHLDIFEVVLMLLIIVIEKIQVDTFVTIKSLLDISPKNVIFLKIFDSEFSYIYIFMYFVCLLIKILGHKR